MVSGLMSSLADEAACVSSERQGEAGVGASGAARGSDGEAGRRAGLASAGLFYPARVLPRLPGVFDRRRRSDVRKIEGTPPRARAALARAPASW